MIKHEEVFPVGQITKTHGIEGELAFSLTSDIFEKEANIPYFVLNINGILVPFFIESVRFKTSRTSFVRFADINNATKAKQLVNLTIYLPNRYIEQLSSDEIQLDYFLGFTLIDEIQGKVGEITKIDDTTENILLIINGEKQEVFIPFNESFIKEINHSKKLIITTNLPEGLLNL